MGRLLDLQFREADDEATHFRKLRALVEEIARLSRQRGTTVADGRQWITIAPVPPENPQVDDLWIDCVNWHVFGWYGDGDSLQWVMPAACGGGAGTPGAQGPQGEPGAAGAAGVGVPVGGAINQVLAKASATDYDTAWVNQTGGGGTGNSYFPGGWG